MEPKITLHGKEYPIKVVRLYSRAFLLIGVLISALSLFLMPIGILLLLLGLFLIIVSIHYRKLIKSVLPNSCENQHSESSVPIPLPFKTDWRNFRVKARHKDTNRFRTVNLLAKSKEQCEAMANQEGFIPPYEVEELPPRMPSEAQLSYAKKLGISIPENITFNEISSLLDRKLNNGGGNPEIGLAEFAMARNLHFSRFIGKNDLYNLVFENLNGKEKIAFFIFSMYRWLSDDRASNLDTHPQKEKFYSLADTLVSDTACVNSLNRYKGSDIKFFGSLHVRGEEYIGGSTNTIAFKTISKLLQDNFNLAAKESKWIS